MENFFLSIFDFSGSIVPFIIIGSLLVLGGLTAYLGLEINRFTRTALIVTPVALLTASAMEAWAFYDLGKQVFWWCDSDTYGFWGAFWRMIPFGICVYVQLISIILYKGMLDIESGSDLALKPLAISLATSIPAFLVTAAICSLLHLPKVWLDIISTSVFLTVLGAGCIKSLYRNIKVLGAGGGIAFTLFGAVYVIGACVAIGGLIMVLFQNFVQTILISIVIAIFTGKTSSEVSVRQGRGGERSKSVADNVEEWRLRSIDMERKREWDERCSGKRK